MPRCAGWKFRSNWKPWLAEAFGRTHVSLDYHQRLFHCQRHYFYRLCSGQIGRKRQSLAYRGKHSASLRSVRRLARSTTGPAPLSPQNEEDIISSCFLDYRHTQRWRYRLAAIFSGRSRFETVGRNNQRHCAACACNKIHYPVQCAALIAPYRKVHAEALCLGYEPPLHSAASTLVSRLNTCTISAHLP
jgi:hypothetical protein